MHKFSAALVLAVFLWPVPAFAARSKTEFTVVNGTDPATLDPQRIQDPAELRIGQALFEGLVVSDNKTAEARPGLAESWSVGKDGRTYTFKLRKTTWSDGTPITAKTVADSWLRAVDPRSGGSAGSLPVRFLAGAADFREGRAGADAVQVRALDDQTFQAAFTGPLPTLSILAQPVFAVVPLHAIERFGRDWTRPENFVGNGPYRLETWAPQTRLTVVPNPRYWDPKAVRLTRITFVPSEDPSAAYSLYRRGGADWLTVLPAEQLDELQRRKDYQSSVLLGTYFYRLNTTNPVLQDPRVRRALALAVDRSMLVKRVTRGGELPAFTLTPRTAGTPVPPYAVKDDPKAAQKLLAEAGFAGGRGFPKLSIVYNTLERHRKVAEAIQDQWKRTLGIEVDLVTKEWKNYVDDLASLQYDISRSAWLGDYDDPLTFLDLWRSDHAENHTGWSDPAYDALILKAQSLAEGSERSKVLRDAEAELMAQMPVIPLYTYTANQLIDLTRWEGWYPNLPDIHSWKNVGPRR